MSRSGLRLPAGVTFTHKGRRYEASDAPREAVEHGTVEYNGRPVQVDRTRLLEQFRVTVEHAGLIYHPWRAPVEAIEHGTFLLDDKPMPEARARRVRASLLGAYKYMPPVSDPTETGPVRALIPGAWQWGTIPLLSGPPKVGKSTLVVQLTAALIILGRRFLGCFEPVQWTDEEKSRDVVLINAENPPESLHAELLAAGLEFTGAGGAGDVPFYSHPDGGPALVVEHLEDLGGADVFDLTVESNRTFWEGRFMSCPCDGVSDREPPLAIIADGVTAFAGLEGAAAWYVEFRRMMRALDVPNALAVGHAGLGQSHAFGATDPMARPDGLWAYSTPEKDVRPSSARYFSITPRMRTPGFDPRRVVVGEDGLLRAVGPEAKEEGETSAVSPDGEAEGVVLGRLTAAGTEGVMGSDLTGGGSYGKVLRAARDRLADAGRIRFQPEGQGRRWFLAVPQ